MTVFTNNKPQIEWRKVPYEDVSRGDDIRLIGAQLLLPIGGMVTYIDNRRMIVEGHRIRRKSIPENGILKAYLVNDGNKRHPQLYRRR